MYKVKTVQQCHMCARTLKLWNLNCKELAWWCLTLAAALFDPIGSLLYASWSDWPPLSAEKNGLSLPHLVPEILGSKVGLIFHKMYYLTVFKHFVSILCLIFNPIDPFFIDLKIFWPSFLIRTVPLSYQPRFEAGDSFSINSCLWKSNSIEEWSLVWKNA